MIVSSIILVLTITLVINFDIRGKNKVYPAMVGAFFLLVAGIFFGDSFNHVFLAGFIEAWQPAVFVLGATFLADSMQQSGAFRQLKKKSKAFFGWVYLPSSQV